MVFIRKKNINGKQYAYLVKNRWTDKGSRQKAKYLGKIIHLDIVDDKLNFREMIQSKFSMNVEEFFRGHSKTEILNEMVFYELIRRGFDWEEIQINDERRNLLANNKYYYRARNLYHKKNHREAIIEINEGFLCKLALDKFARTKIEGYDEREKGIQLAKLLLEAGLKIDRDLFVLMFEKWDKE
ncbi:hypothetical protein H6503_06440 [Candidatus Woesearchaeota archaeon]|nr:hypothetical protein [Candidatus Woesearchaeota archaeon]